MNNHQREKEIELRNKFFDLKIKDYNKIADFWLKEISLTRENTLEEASEAIKKKWRK